MNYPKPFRVTDGLTYEEDAEGLNLIGWCWRAPQSVRLIVGQKVYVDMSDRTVRQIPKDGRFACA